MYFNTFPIIPYDSTGTGNLKAVTNLLRRVALRNKARTDRLLFDTYDVKNGETPESIAFKLYGDSELHWVIMLINDITDRYHDWPMGENQFNEFLNDKYDDVNAVHHYEITQSSGDTKLKINIGTDNRDYSTAAAITNFDFEVREQDKKRQIRLLDPAFIQDFIEEFKTLMNISVI
tara:strand:- start:147 stop:674 length:528 start_codon:yes stop_codon:yes gene_type:complete